MNALETLLFLNTILHVLSLSANEQKPLVVCHHFCFVETRSALRTKLDDFLKSAFCLWRKSFTSLHKIVKLPQMFTKALNFFISCSYTRSPVAKRRVEELSQITFPLFLWEIRMHLSTQNRDSTLSSKSVASRYIKVLHNTLGSPTLLFHIHLNVVSENVVKKNWQYFDICLRQHASCPAIW